MSGTVTETTDAPVGRRRRRGRELAGLAIGLAAGLAIALTWLVPLHRHPAVQPPVVIRATIPGPAALDAEWIAYSDRSSCADWAGGDGASAVRLNSGQLAWFFSDTTIGPAGPTTGFSHLSGFVHNSLVVQTTTAKGSTFVTMTGGGACTGPDGPGNAAPVVGPAPAYPGGPSDRYWDEDGLTIDGTILKFYNHYRVGIQPYVPLGTVIAAFRVSQLSQAGRGSRYGAVARPRLIPLPSYTPAGGGAPIMWGAALLQAGNMVYVYGTQSPNIRASDARLYLARVPAAELTSFGAWRFYAGNGQWAAEQGQARPVQPATGGGLVVASGFSVVHLGHRYWLIQIDPALGTTGIEAYPAATPWGPFDVARGRLLYRDPSIGLDAAHEYRIMYEARAEPALSTASTLVISYNVNSEAVTAGCAPMSQFTNTVILPRFVAVPLTAFARGVTSGPSDPARGVTSGPPLAQQDPSRWLDAWAYPGDCPPVPRVNAVQARAGPGKVTLTWPDLGLNISYRIDLRGPGQARTATHADQVTVTGLSPGTYRASVVPVNFYKHTGPAGQVTFTVP